MNYLGSLLIRDTDRCYTIPGKPIGSYVVKFEIENSWCSVRKEVFRLGFLQVIPENTRGSDYTDNTGSLRRFGIPEGFHPVIEVALGGTPEEST